MLPSRSGETRQCRLLAFTPIPVRKKAQSSRRYSNHSTHEWDLDSSKKTHWYSPELLYVETKNCLLSLDTSVFIRLCDLEKLLNISGCPTLSCRPRNTKCETEHLKLTSNKCTNAAQLPFWIHLQWVSSGMLEVILTQVTNSTSRLKSRLG